MKQNFLILISLLFSLTVSHAQEKKLLREGNSLYQQGRYDEAADRYQKALSRKPSAAGLFNLGNAYFRQFQKEDSAKGNIRQATPGEAETNKQLEAARSTMDAAAKQATDKLYKAGAQYNVGNTYMAEQKWKEAVESYKQALRNNPQDADAKYNLSYALQKLKQQQQQQNKNDKNKDQDKKEQQKQDEQKDKKDQEQKQGQDKQQQKEQQEQKQNQPQPSKLSEQQAEQILNALMQEEKNLQDKKQKAKGVPVKMDKDW